MFDASLDSVRLLYGEDDTASYAYVLTLAAVASERNNNADDAEKYYLMASGIYEKVNGTSDSFYWLIRSNLGLLYLNKGRYRDAISILNAVLERNRIAYGKMHTIYALSLNNLAVAYEGMGYYDKALPLYEEALLITEQLFGKPHEEYGSSLNNLAGLYRRLGKYELALTLSVEALQNALNNFGKNHPEYAKRLYFLAETNRLLNNDSLAIELYLEAASSIEKTIGLNSDFYSYCLAGLGAVYVKTEDFNNALTCFKDALQITIDVLGTKHPEYIYRLSQLSSLYETMNLYDDALALYPDIMSVTEASFGKEHQEYAFRLNNMASIYESMGVYEKALPLYDSALTIVELTLGRNHTEYGKIQNNLASLFHTLGQYDKALPLFKETLDNCSMNYGEKSSVYALRLNNMALLYESMGQLDTALVLLTTALEINKTDPGIKHSSYGGRLTNLANIYRKLGQYEKAIELSKEAVENAVLIYGKTHSVYAIRLSNLGLVYEDMGRYSDALNIARESLRIIGDVFGKEHPEYSVRLNNLGVLCSKTSRFDEAAQCFSEALAISQKVYGKEYYDYGVKLNNLAMLYDRMGQYNKAEPLYIESLANAIRNLGDKHPDYGLRLNNLATLYRNSGAFEKADTFFRASLDNMMWNIRQNFSFLPESEKEKFIDNILGNLMACQSFMLAYASIHPQAAATLYNIELATRGMILRSGISMRQTILNTGDVDALSRFDEWMALRSILATQYASPLASRRNDILNLEENANKIEGELMRISAAFTRSEVSSDIDFNRVAQNLKPGEAAIEFVTFQLNNGLAWTDSTVYLALVLRYGDSIPHAVPLFEQKQIDGLLSNKEVTDAIAVNTIYRGASVLNNSDESLNAQLYSLVWQPFDDLLKTCQTVYYSPSGTLHQIAFAAIATDSVTRLCDRYNLIQLSSSSVLIEEVDSPLNGHVSIALFGGIDYDTQNSEEQIIAGVQHSYGVSRSLPGDLERGGVSWSYLPGTLSEVEHVASKAKRSGAEVKLYTGTTASEGMFKSLTGNNAPSILHFATHGFFFPDPESLQKVESFASDVNSSVYRESANPLNRSGLLFAGANTTRNAPVATQGKDDGILTAYEAANVNLSRTRLVVLSACETGLGDIKGSEGVFGLQRAFRSAGAEYVIMSLWKVPDNETSEFMTLFYEKLLGENAITVAFNHARNTMRHKYPDDPYKWGAFVLVH